MATLVLRTIKGSPLTNLEIDNNFSNINVEVSSVESNAISNIGILTNLTTSATNNVVEAVNELTANIGQFSDLNLGNTSNLVVAINEIVSNVGVLSSLTTFRKDSIVASINELDTDVGDLTDLNTANTGNLVFAINEVLSEAGDATDIGILSNLTTINQDNLVSAINEVNLGASSNIQITGGNITGANIFNLAIAVPIADGGTGGTTANEARNNLGIGTGDTVTFGNVDSPLGFISALKSDNVNATKVVTGNVQGMEQVVSGDTGQFIIYTSNVVFDSQTYQKQRATVNKFNSFNVTSSNVTYNLLNHDTFFHGSINQNWTGNFTGNMIADGEVLTTTLFLDQGSTAYVPINVQVGGVAPLTFTDGVTGNINWEGGVRPNGVPNAINFVTLTIYNFSGNYYVYGQLRAFNV